MRKFTHPFMHLLVLAMFSLALMVLSVIFGMVLGVGTVGKEEGESAFLCWNAFSQVLMFGLPPVLVAMMYYRREMGTWLRLDFSGHRWLLALVGVVILLLLVPATDWLTTWNDNWHWSGPWKALERSLREAGEMSQHTVESMMRECHPLLNLFGLALVPAVCEELFFRAGVQNLLQRWFKNVHVAVWITAAIFSLAHFEIFAFLPRFLLGGLLGYLYVGGRSLLVSMVAHFVNNAIVVMLFWWASVGNDIDPTASLGIDWTVTLACSFAAVMLFVVTFGKGLKTSK